jgi:hypothetical protein
VGHPGEVQRLPSDDLHRRRVPRRVHLLEDMDRVADGGQRVPKLVAHHRHELIFAVIRLFGGLERVPQLPSGRRELGERPDDPLILPVELPLIGMAHDPHRSHRPAVNPKRNEQDLDEARLRPQGRKVTIRQVHQLGDILIDAHAARAGRTGHRTVPVRSEHPGHRFPSKHVPFEEADTGRIGSSAVSTSFWSMLRGFSVISRASTASARSRPSESGNRGGRVESSERISTSARVAVGPADSSVCLTGSRAGPAVIPLPRPAAARRQSTRSAFLAPIHPRYALHVRRICP